MFRALVHDTPKSPGEKLALLKRFLCGDCLDLVYGLGGGEAAYIETLVRLKQTCGRRDVMRAAHHQAIQRLETKQDPASFKRFAERIRTHLFDLSRIGETGRTDLIEKICLKLHLHDRLAWNEDRRGRIEDRNLNTFGRWLCSRASAYQNAFSIAADQVNPASSKPTNQRRQARTNQSSAKIAGEKKQVAFQFSGKPFCFKCEKGHRLPEVRILSYSPLGSVLLSACVGVFASVASQLNIQFTNVTGEDHVNTLVAVIIITRCYTMLPRKHRGQKPKKELDQQSQELEPLERSPWVCCVSQ